jgi:hypothetical protein
MNERSGCYEVVFVGRVDALLTQIDRFREPSPALVGDVAGERSVGWFPLCRERAQIPLPVKKASCREVLQLWISAINPQFSLVR